jgi:hypothetical protein
VNTRENTSIFQKTLKPTGITKHNLSSKVKDQKIILTNKEKGTVLKNALLQDTNQLTNSLKSIKTEKVSYRDLVFNVLKKKNV